MFFKKKLQSLAKTTDNMVYVYFISGKIIFIVTSFLFFLGYVAITSGFYGDIFFPFFLPLYISFVLGLNLFLGVSIFYFLKNKIPFWALLGLLSIPVIYVGIFLYPIL